MSAEDVVISIESHSLTKFNNPATGIMSIPSVNRQLEFEIRYHYREYNDKGCYYLFTDTATGERYGGHYSARAEMYFCDGVIPSANGIGGDDYENETYDDSPFLAVAKYVVANYGDSK